jgi:hypothetical protein
MSGAKKINHEVTVKSNWGIQLEAGFGYVSRDTIFKTLHAREIKPYVNKYKFILDEENKKQRVASTIS